VTAVAVEDGFKVSLVPRLQLEIELLDLYTSLSVRAALNTKAELTT
jgi:hypothetical protein